MAGVILSDGGTSWVDMTGIGPELLAELLVRHGPALELYARQLCHTPSDVVQDALVNLARQPRAPENVVAWLYRAVRNGAISAARADARRRRHEAAAAQGRTPWFVAVEDDPLDAAAAERALAKLATDQREMIVLRIWGGLTFEEIGAVSACSASAAHRRYHAALDCLRERLEQHVPPTKKL